MSGAFNHIPVHEDHVGRFSGTVPELGILVIDLSCPFGWRLSPQHYWTAGAAITHLYVASAPTWPLQPSEAATPFDCKTWCDDHNLIEPYIGTRLGEGNLALRGAIVSILGPEAINEEKFTLWFKRGKALGLLWDIPNGSLAMPRDKVAKALGRVNALLESTVTSRSQVYKLLESLRHVVTCVRSGTPFFQSLAALTYSTRRSVQIPVTDAVRDDLNWFRIILGAADLNSIPLSRFTNSQRVDFDIYMDASNYGLCALFPARREFLQVQFDEMELQSIEEFRCTGSGDLGINLRELMSAAFASIVWCKYWTGTSRHHLKHVRFWIDNKAAVSWNNRRSSRNKTAQTVLRILSVLETINSFYTTAEHISGADNTMADADRECGKQVPIPTNLLTFRMGGNRCRSLLHQGNFAESGSTSASRGPRRIISHALPTILEAVDRLVSLDELS
ncbi:hypothetical protein F444_13537 [Phytophthora nicotianae P1976]|uniref:Uncharacterized protein n=1 Tax=Phytophthora nicotianae P1976 TaxID=1317066 RepID=A0A080ZTI8_PHYNI|nr:hypothetical protein F444_13537 [Phytophthora nicotianae P1976]